MRRLILVLALLLAGCAYDGRNLVPGKSTERDAIEQMGKPALELALPGGRKALYFSRLPIGREIHEATFAADGSLIGVRQTLTLANVASIQVGQTTKEQARELLGPPYRVTREPLKPMDTWEYPWRNVEDRRILWISFSDDGVARDKIERHDYESDPPSGPSPGGGMAK